jgi:predicted MFS family arabinose efflux permease
MKLDHLRSHLPPYKNGSMRNVPSHVKAVLEALKFGGARRGGLLAMTDSEWQDLLSLGGFVRLTLPLRQLCGDDLPNWVREQIDQNIADNTERFSRIRKTYVEIASALQCAGAEYVVLKGFAQWPASMQGPHIRAQSDIDLFSPPESILAVRDALSSIGYAPVPGQEHQPKGHLPDMMRETTWRWRGNYYDPEMPLGVDLHSRFWNEAGEHLDAKGVEEFWNRRVKREWQGLAVPALHPVDAFGYAALHVLHHLLLDAPTPYNVYELAWFLHCHAKDQAFWTDWKELHNDSMRQLEAVSFRLAHEWFDCSLHEAVEEEVNSLSPEVKRWFDCYRDSPLDSVVRPNKHALWLHLSLLRSTRDKAVVFCGALLPLRVPPAKAVQGWSARTFASFGSYVLRRLGYHLQSLPATLWEGGRWWWARKELRPDFLQFLVVSFLVDTGMFVFFFLYNLYLLDCGFNEKFLGLVTSAMAVGSIAGTVPAGIMGQRFGLRRTILLCLALVTIVSVLRALFVQRLALIGLSFLAGATLTIWAVSISPAIAQLTSERNRAFAFSLICSSGIGLGVLGGQLGGHLPGLMALVNPLLTAAGSKRLSLLIACGIVASGIWPALRLRFPPLPTRAKTIYPRGPFLYRFLPAIAVWGLVTGAFSPFYNAYFSQYLHMPVERIGTVFSVSHVSQVVAILLTPVIFRKFGLVTGIVYTQIGTALTLGWLASSSAASAAAVAYVVYSGFQWMSEPGMLNLMMDQVAPSEQSGASALNFLATNISGAVAAAVAGASFTQFGYRPVLAVTAGVALAAALLFRLLLKSRPGEVAPAAQPQLAPEFASITPEGRANRKLFQGKGCRPPSQNRAI